MAKAIMTNNGLVSYLIARAGGGGFPRQIKKAAGLYQTHVFSTSVDNGLVKKSRLPIID